MRTTLTLDDDVSREVEARMRRDGLSMREVVNDLLRRGIRAADKPLPRGPKARVETFSSPWAPGVDAGKLNQLNDELEVAEFLRKHRGDAR